MRKRGLGEEGKTRRRRRKMHKHKPYYIEKLWNILRTNLSVKSLI